MTVSHERTYELPSRRLSADLTLARHIQYRLGDFRAMVNRFAVDRFPTAEEQDQLDMMLGYLEEAAARLMLRTTEQA
jgi:hypothetical protein